ncbi:hypothetical protein [Nocardiopsis sp. YSL2]|uniref:hypothetical protein n=1 Tax=Nocardiopsis sp. YSL2 TaxID=2939492 RepID=UPI0026F47731|nr:hypothetical protein [Nocardiopsis sp. YSL2]
MNIDLVALLGTARDALHVLPAKTPGGQQRRNELVAERAEAVREALAYAVITEDLAGAVEMVEAATKEHPREAKTR